MADDQWLVMKRGRVILMSVVLAAMVACGEVGTDADSGADAELASDFYRVSSQIRILLSSRNLSTFPMGELGDRRPASISVQTATFGRMIDAAPSSGELKTRWSVSARLTPTLTRS